MFVKLVNPLYGFHCFLDVTIDFIFKCDNINQAIYSYCHYLSAPLDAVPHRKAGE